MLRARPRHRLATMVTFVPAIALASSGWAQTPPPNGNQSGFRDWQPTRGQVSTEEDAAGIRPSTGQRNAEDKELKEIDQQLMRQEQPAAPR
jgi:hypothetical protein